MLSLFQFIRFLLGKFKGYRHISKFGRTTNANTNILTDVYDRANIADNVPIWVAPTEARQHTIVSSDATDVAGIGTLTLTGNFSDGDTITIGGKVYTMETSLTNVDGNVLIGAAATNSIDNLIAAINLAAGAGSLYATLMTANDDTTVAYVGAGDTMSLYSNIVIATTKVAAAASWGGAITVLGASAQVIKIWGLTSWAPGSKEVSEECFMRGVDGFLTTNEYVIIYRKRIIDNGNTSINAGTITATAVTDGSVTAQIQPLAGQTQMTIYAIPEGETLFIERAYANMNKAGGATVRVDVSLLINLIPTKSLIPFIVRLTLGLMSVGTSAYTVSFKKPKIVVGPAIIKIQVKSSAVNIDVSAGYDGFIAPTGGGSRVK